MKALIVDDEYRSAHYLEELIQREISAIKQVDVLLDSVEALKFMAKHQPDILFVDIEMPYLNGFELVQSMANNVPVVFTTAYSNYAIQAFDVGALHYLVKPIDPKKLSEAVDRCTDKRQGESNHEIINKLSSYTSRISLASGKDYYTVKHNEIVRVEGDGSYSRFYLADGRKIITSKRLKLYAKLFEPRGFIRTHQSHLVNVNYIDSFSKSDGGSIRLKNGNSVPAGKTYRAAVLSFFGV